MEWKAAVTTRSCCVSSNLPGASCSLFEDKISVAPGVHESSRVESLVVYVALKRPLP